MRHVILGAVVCVCVGLASVVRAQAPDPQLVAPINKFVDAFNKGDMAGAATTHAADVVILDEVAPYLWRGAKALQAWATDLEADAKKKGITEPKVTIKAPTRVETDGSSAYVVVPSVYTFKQGGVPMREAAQFTFTLKKEASGWLINGWTWTGPKPQKAAGAAAK